MSADTVFFVPHQDDELITMGVAIARAAQNDGAACVLLTDGRNCETRLVLSDGSSCADLKDAHKYQFDVFEYGKLRDVEFIESCKALGVPEQRIYVATTRMEDGTATVEGAKRAMEEALERCPGARIATHLPINAAIGWTGDERLSASEDKALRFASDTKADVSLTPGPDFALEHVRPDGDCLAWATQHPDHIAAGVAALQLFDEGKVDEVLFLIEPYHLAQFMSKRKASDDVARKETLDLITLVANAAEASALDEAVKQYSKWDPKSNRYALGIHSARLELNALKSKPYSYCITLKRD